MALTIARAEDLSLIGANGNGWVAPAGTTAPTDPTTQPTTPWASMGATSDDGLVYGFSEDSTSFTPWGTTSPWRTVVTSSVRTFKQTLWETLNPVARSLMYRLDVDDLQPDETGLVSYAETGSPTPDRRAFWFVVLDGDNSLGFYVPQGEVSDRGDVTFKQDTQAGFELTITAYPDDAGNTVYHTDKLVASDAS